MYVILTVVRYPRLLWWAGLLSMALFRVPMGLNRKFSFYKLLGCGKGGTFSKTPDLRQWGVLAVLKAEVDDYTNKNLEQVVYGRIITAWWRLFKVKKWTLVLKPLEGRGTWDKQEAFGDLPGTSNYNGVIAILTRATIRISRLRTFWQNVESVAAKMSTAPGLITSLGVGEMPWIKQATFSIWKDKESFKSFAYSMQEHVEIIRKTRRQNWYSEDMFVRFQILQSQGSLNGCSPLEKL